MSALGAGCSAPVAAYAAVTGEEIRLEGVVAAPDGSHVLRVSGSGTDALALGQRLAQEAMDSGAAGIMTLADQEGTKLVFKGRRIVVTRPQGQAGALSERLAALGAAVLEIPLIRIAPVPDKEALDRAIQSLDAYDWVIFTSVNGVAMFWDRMMALAGAMPADAAVDQAIAPLGKVRIATVGPATASAVIERGAQPAFTPDEFIGEAVAAGLGDVRGQRILLPRAEIGRKNLPELLRSKGAEVDDLPIYRTLPAKMSAQDLVELERGVDVVTFTSSSAVHSWVEQVDPLKISPLIACIGPVTAKTASEVGLNPVVVAAQYNLDGLVQALSTHFQENELP